MFNMEIYLKSITEVLRKKPEDVYIRRNIVYCTMYYSMHVLQYLLPIVNTIVAITILY